MNSFLTIFASLVTVAAGAWGLGWSDSFHWVCGLLLCTAALVVTAPIVLYQRRVTREAFGDDSIDSDGLPSSPVRGIFLGLVLGGCLLVVSSVGLKGLEHSIVYGIFNDDRDVVMSHVEKLQCVGNYAEICRVVEDRLAKPASEPYKKELIQLLYNTRLEWSKIVQLLDDQLALLRKAIESVSGSSVDDSMAQEWFKQAQAQLSQANKIDQLMAKRDYQAVIANTRMFLDIGQYPTYLTRRFAKMMYEAYLLAAEEPVNESRHVELLAQARKVADKFNFDTSVISSLKQRFKAQQEARVSQQIAKKAQARLEDTQKEINRLEKDLAQKIDQENQHLPRDVGSGISARVLSVNQRLWPMMMVDLTVKKGAKYFDMLQFRDFVVSGGNTERVPHVMTYLDERHNTLPIRLVLALDKSGSMRGKAMAKAKAATKRFIKTLAPSTHVELLGFGSRVKTLVPFTVDQQEVISAVDGIKASGKTALYGAIHTAVNRLTETVKPGEVPVLVILSDGRNTVKGRIDFNAILAACAQAGVRVFTIGLKNKDLDVATLRRIAEMTQGQFRQVDDPHGFVEAFESAANQITQPLYRLVFNASAMTPSSGTVGKESVVKISIGSTPSAIVEVPVVQPVIPAFAHH